VEKGQTKALDTSDLWELLPCDQVGSLQLTVLGQFLVGGFVYSKLPFKFVFLVLGFKRQLRDGEFFDGAFGKLFWAVGSFGAVWGAQPLWGPALMGTCTR
jgi:hypothetical protein